MPEWSSILNEITLYSSDPNQQMAFLEQKRLDYLKKISEKTGRNVITYYSGWLVKPELADIVINDNDKNAFMQAVYKLDKNKGLDLILHTPGGDIAATESIVDYLHSIFKDDIRAIIPQLAMSAGTMIALSCSSIMMGKQSSLGPIDPQYRGISCQEALDEFEKAKQEVKADLSCLGLWQQRISSYTPTFLISCANAIDWSKSLAEQWINNNPKIKDENKSEILKEFEEHSQSKSHSRHLSLEKCKQVGLNIEEMEKDNELQDFILSLHHCYMILFGMSCITKAVENQIGSRYLKLFIENQPK